MRTTGLLAAMAGVACARGACISVHPCLAFSAHRIPVLNRARVFVLAVSAVLITGCATMPLQRTEPPRHSRTSVWIASLRIMGLFRTNENGDPLVSNWDFVSENIDGIKFWDGQIDGKSDAELGAIFTECRRRGLRIAYEKGRWPLPEELFELELKKQVEKQGSEEKAREHIHRDRGRVLTSFDPEIWARTAAEPEIARLKRIRDAGGLDLMQFIDLDGAVLKNVFPYAFALTQWGLTDAPEEKRFQRGFADPAAFIHAFSRMVEAIRAEIPEAGHVMYRMLPNVHFWS